ncbi:MAG: hypothetical protein JWN89_159 [Parcubacteria group bacterium]|nr:hypothetical protein [Parcubacteria group bacterium]
MKFWPSNDLSNLNLIIDISAGSIGVALIKISKDKVPHMLASIRPTFHMQKGASLAERENAMIRSLEDALARLHQNVVGSLPEKGTRSEVSKVVIALSSPWLISKTFLKNITKDAPFLLDESIGNEALKEEEARFKKELDAEYVEETEVFESKITGLFLNGYETRFPIKKRTASADLRLIMSATKSSLVKRIEGEIIKFFFVNEGVAIESFMGAYFRVFTHAFNDLHSALFVSMTSEITDLLFLKKGQSISTTSLQFGTGTILERIEAEMRMPYELAHSYLALYSESFLVDEIRDDISRIVDDAAASLAAMWQRSKSVADGDADHPYRVYVVGAYGFEGVAKKILEDVLPGHDVIIVGKDNSFTEKIISLESNVRSDEKLTILSAHAVIAS